jgi:hypothetical protein
MRKVILLLIIFSFSFSCKENNIEPHITTSIKGKIIDGSTRKPIDDVVITLKPNSNSITYKKNGTFTISNLEEGYYFVSASKFGFSGSYSIVKVVKDKTSEIVITLYDKTTNNPPGTSVLISPRNQSVIFDTNITLSWLCYDKDNETLNYTVLFSKENPPTTPIAENITSKLFEINDLDTSRTYYWRVIARDKYTFSESEIFSFKIKEKDIPRNDLILYYSFDNNDAKDESGNGKDGIMVNSPEFVSGKHGKAVHLDGSRNQYIKLPRIAFNNKTEFTISAWINQRKQITEGGGAYLIWGLHSDGWVGIGNFKNVNTNLMNINFSCGAIAVGWVYWPLVVDYQEKYSMNWVNYTMVYRDGNVTGFINGNNIGANSQNLSELKDYASIGQHWWFYGSLQSSTGLDFWIDDVLIYNRALNGDEIYKLSQ